MAKRLQSARNETGTVHPTIPSAVPDSLPPDRNVHAEHVARLLLAMEPDALFAACLDEEAGSCHFLDQNSGIESEALVQSAHQADGNHDGRFQFVFSQGRRTFPVLAARVAAAPLVLLLGVPARVSKSRRAAAAAQLDLVANSVGLQHRLGTCEQQLKEKCVEQRELDEQLILSDAMLGCIHELNNILNSITLQTSIIELKCDSSITEVVEPIRTSVSRIAKKLQLFQGQRELRKAAKSVVNLNTLIAQCSEEGPADGAVQIQLCDSPLWINCNQQALRRLVTTLCRWSGPWKSDEYRIQTDLENGQVVLRLMPKKSDGPRTPIDLAESTANSSNQLQRLATLSLARLTGGAIAADAGPNGEAALTIRWPFSDKPAR